MNIQKNNFIFIDKAITKKGKFLLMICTPENTHYKVYDEPVVFDLTAHQFIADTLKQTTAKMVVGDCGIEFWPTNLKAIENCNKEFVHGRINKPHARAYEKVMNQLLNNN